MKKSKDLDPQATICPHHPKMKFSLISLQKEPVKRLFCIDCFDGNNGNSGTELISLKKVISLSAINEHQKRHEENKLKAPRPEDVGYLIKSALTEVEEAFTDYIKYIQTIQKSFEQNLIKFLENKILDKNKNSEDISKELEGLIEGLRQTLGGFNKNHTLTEGLELELYLSSFRTLKNSKHFEELNKLFDEAKNSSKFMVHQLKEQLDLLKQLSDTTIKLDLFQEKTIAEKENAEKGRGRREDLKSEFNDSGDTLIISPVMEEEKLSEEELEEEFNGNLEMESREEAESREESKEESKIEPSNNETKENTSNKLNVEVIAKEKEGTCISNYSNSFTVSLDGKWMISASKEFRIWDLQTKTLSCEFDQEHQSSITHVEISRDGSQILSAATDDSIALWSVNDKKLLAIQREAHGRRARPRAIKFSPGEVFIASVGSSILKIWVNDSLSLFLAHKSDHIKGVHSLAFHPNGAYLLTGGGDMKICCWDLNEDLDSVFVLNAHLSTNADNVLQFDSTGERFMSVTCDNSIKLWDFATRTIIFCVESTSLGKSVEISSLVPGDFCVFYSLEMNGEMKAWKIGDNGAGVNFRSFTGMKRGGWINCIRVLGNEKYIMASRSDREFKIIEP